MKILILSLALLVACGKRENAWDELTDDERTFIRDQELAKCRNQVTGWTDSFIASSNANMLRNSAWARGKYYVHDFKETSATDPMTKHNIYTYKQDSNGQALYLLVKQIDSQGDQLWYFLKVTPSENEAFLDTFKDQICVDGTKVTGELSDTTFTIKVADISKGSDGGDNFIFEDETTKYSTLEPAIIGTLFKMNRIRKVVDENDKEVSRKTYNSTFKEETSGTFVTNPTLIVSDGIPRLDLNGNGVLTQGESELNFYFCDTPGDFNFPVEFNPKQCPSRSSGIPADWDLSL